MINFRLTDEMNPRNAAKVADHLCKDRLWVPTLDDYPAHAVWIEKSEERLVHGDHRALVSELGNVAAGAIVFRPEADDPQTVAIRNISINPDCEGRYVGAFMLRNIEYVIRESYPEATRIIVDTKTTNHSMIAFLESQHYSPKEIVDLYQSGKPDIVLTKDLYPQDAAVVPPPSGGHSIR